MEFIKKLEENSSYLHTKRTHLLERLVRSIRLLNDEQGYADVVFVCTHNSRRSQIAELTLHILSEHFGLRINTESAGTEATACNPRVVTAFQSFDLSLAPQDQSDNPRYIFSGNTGDKPIYSKTIQQTNTSNKVIVTVCSDADQNCPVILDAYRRIHIGYEDPKAFDDKPTEKLAYSDKILEIGGEMYYVAEKLANTWELSPKNYS